MGIAGRLASAALEFAKQENYKVRSYCAFTTSYLERHPEYNDLLG
jgi:predicted GNAT family acetyltransferase